MISARAMILWVLSLALCACAALGLGVPRGRAIPLTVKEDGDHGRCASSGYEVDIPPHATVATIASVCVRPFDAGSGSADAGVVEPSPPRAPPPLTTPIQTFPLRPPIDRDADGGS